MSLTINQNITSLNAWRNLGKTDRSMSATMEKLSSGLRINRASDDPSGLIISEQMRAQVVGLKAAVKNSEKGISMIQTAEAALDKVHSLLDKMRGLALDSANTATSDSTMLAANQAEVNNIIETINRISTNTQYGTKVLLDGSNAGTTTSTTTYALGAASGAPSMTFAGTPTAAGTFSVTVADNLGTLEATVSFDDGVNPPTTGIPTAIAVNDGSAPQSFTVAGQTIAITFNGAADTETASVGSTGTTTSTTTGGLTFQVGANANQTVNISINSVSATALGISAVNVSTDPQAAIGLIDTAIDTVSTLRGTLGAFQANTLEANLDNLRVAAENLQASESVIRDTDMAAEMATFTKYQIMMQAGTAMLAQANQIPNNILQLLRG